MKFGIIKERKNPPDRRVVFTPEELVRLKSEHPEAEIKVENNRDRIVGPGANERLSFIKNIKLIK